MRSTVAVILGVTLLVMVTGCVGDTDPPTSGAVDADASADALSNLTSYQFETELVSDLRLEGAPSSMPGANATVSVERNVTGAVDRTARAVSVRAVSTTNFGGTEAGPGATAGPRAEQHLVVQGDTVYIGEARNGSVEWVRDDRNRLVRRVMTTQDQAAKLSAVLSAASLTDQGETTMRGITTRVATVDIDGPTYRGLVQRQMGGTGFGGLQLGRNGTSLRNMTMRVWIAENDTPMGMEMTAQVRTRQRSLRGTTTRVRDMTVTTWFSSLAAPVDVTVPDAALEAPTIAELRRNATNTTAGAGSGTARAPGSTSGSASDDARATNATG
jgi:hypothetical protein